MLRGHLDAVTSSGYIEGWAYDGDHLTLALEVSVVVGGAEVAWGLAHRFRQDLMSVGCALGWCAFRLRLEAPLDEVSGKPVRLLERRSAKELFFTPGLAFVEEVESPLASVEDIALSDPTVIRGTWQLQRCEALLMQFIRRHGVEEFLSAAYAYVLGRPADENGLTLYGRHIRHATLGPVQILEALADSDEFRSRQRQLPAPNSPTFPFA